MQIRKLHSSPRWAKGEVCQWDCSYCKSRRSIGQDKNCSKLRIWRLATTFPRPSTTEGISFILFHWHLTVLKCFKLLFAWPLPIPARCEERGRSCIFLLWLDFVCISNLINNLSTLGQTPCNSFLQFDFSQLYIIGNMAQRYVQSLSQCRTQSSYQDQCRTHVQCIRLHISRNEYRTKESFQISANTSTLKQATADAGTRAMGI